MEKKWFLAYSLLKGKEVFNPLPDHSIGMEERFVLPLAERVWAGIREEKPGASNPRLIGIIPMKETETLKLK